VASVRSDDIVINCLPTHNIMGAGSAPPQSPFSGGFYGNGGGGGGNDGGYSGDGRSGLSGGGGTARQQRNPPPEGGRMNQNNFGMHAAPAGGQQQHIVAGLFAETQLCEQRTLLRNKRNLMDVTLEFGRQSGRAGG